MPQTHLTYHLSPLTVGFLSILFITKSSVPRTMSGIQGTLTKYLLNEWIKKNGKPLSLSILASEIKFKLVKPRDWWQTVHTDMFKGTHWKTRLDNTFLEQITCTVLYSLQVHSHITLMWSSPYSRSILSLKETRALHFSVHPKQCLNPSPLPSTLRYMFLCHRGL